MKRFLCCVWMVVALIGAARPERSTQVREDRRFQGQIGLRIPELGIAVDAVYDARLDGLVPGYKLLNVMIANESPNKLFLSEGKDRFVLQDVNGTRHKAELSLAHSAVWKSLPQALQDRLVYPQTIAPGAKASLTLFFKDRVELSEFRSLSFRSSYLKKELIYYSEGIPFEEKGGAM